MLCNFEEFINSGKATFESKEIPKAILEHCDNDISKDKFNVVIEKIEEGE